ncbi:hypothetical protein [Halobacterium wangiae]|uniref:hypothetical protein n=1 Tax=Halobacterium wangiae TaxID=2902623 RepID=UPI001E50F2F3|nr:hypothetical protein [Halobacterium wangiae]
MNQRTLFQWLGFGLVVVGVGALAATFPPGPVLAVQMVLLAVAGALFFVAGVTDRLRWGLLVGVGDVALGGSLVVGGVTDAAWEGTELLYTVAVLLGGVSLVAIGVLYVLDHESLDTP